MAVMRNAKVLLMYVDYLTRKNFYKTDTFILMYDIRNWGDQINKHLAPCLGSGFSYIDIDMRNRYLKTSKAYAKNREILMIGSIAQHCRNNSEVWGSGVIDPSIPMRSPPRRVWAVRGPLTQTYFKNNAVPCPEVFGDPALLLPRYFQPVVEKTQEMGIILHNDHQSAHIPHRDEVLRISLRWGFDKVLRSILSCERIISSSLHGLIVSDAYGIPNVRLVTDKPLRGGDFKFDDYYDSIRWSRRDVVHLSELQHGRSMKAQCVSRDINLNLEALEAACPLNAS
jgi:pyruvyltransferase